MVKLLDLQAITAQHGDEYKAAVNRVIDSGDGSYCIFALGLI